MEHKPNESNLFADFLKVFTGLIIGLASFQILAPLIWNYLSELLHLEKYTSYVVIVSFYFVLPGILLLLWWYNNKHKLAGLLSIHPNRKDEADYTLVIKTLSIFFPVFFLLNTLFFLFGFYFDIPFLFYGLQIAATLVCMFVLGKIVNSVLRNLAEERVKKKRKHHALIGLMIFLFFLFLIFEIIYLTYTDKSKINDITTFEKYKINNKAEIFNAFRLNDFKEELITVRKKFEYNLDRIHQMQDIHNFDRTVNISLPSGVTNMLDSILENREVSQHILDTRRQTYADTHKSIDLEMTSQALLSLTLLLDRVSDSIAENRPVVTLARPPYKLQSLLGYEKIRTIHYEDSVSLAVKEIKYKNIITTIQILESNLAKLCRRQLNSVLNNNQMKGIFLFAFALVIMLCFYLLLKTNEDIFYQLQAKEENKNSELINSKSVLNKGALSDVWIIVNILVWLLIPLLKPVSEESIRIDKPFQSLTFSKYVTTERTVETSPPIMINSQHPLTINSYASGEIKTQPVVIIDTVWLRSEIDVIKEKIAELQTNPSIVDTAENADLRTMLEAIQRRVNNINSSAQNANVLRKLHRHNREGTAPERIDNNTFKPDSHVR